MGKVVPCSVFIYFYDFQWKTKPSPKIFIFSMSQGRGRGAYYKEKYGGGRGGGRVKGRSGRGPHGGQGGERDNIFKSIEEMRISSRDELISILRRIDRGQYGGYKQIRGVYDFVDFELGIVHVQSDAYARPSRVFVRVPLRVSNIPPVLLSNKTRSVAMADFLSRHMCELISQGGADQRSGGSGWSGAKGGELRMEKPGQAVLERTSVQINTIQQCIEARFEVGLPASGRTIEGRWAQEILTETLPRLIESGLLWRTINQRAAERHVLCVEDQESLRAQLKERGLISFVADGSILPRLHGQSDKPMVSSDSVPFKTPETLRQEFKLPNRSTVVVGMGIPRGVSVIVGGGFHGKSTLLQAIQLGIYNHIPGDGRELVSTIENAVKIRAEDGRPITNLDISAFINNLPFDKSTEAFTTADASGSTSQAANIAEAMELGVGALLLDEDTCATNFMYRDERMASLVHKDKEPITPFLTRVRHLYAERGISSLLVVGSCGAYFDVADTVICLDSYVVSDVTAAAHATRSPHGAAGCVTAEKGMTEGSIFDGKVRKLDCISLRPAGAGKVNVHDIHKVFYGSDEITINLRGLEQLVEKSQVVAIADAMQHLASKTSFVTSKGGTLSSIMAELDMSIDRDGLDAIGLSDKSSYGGYARPRMFELAAAINRWREVSYKST